MKASDSCKIQVTNQVQLTDITEIIQKVIQGTEDT